MLGLKVRTLGVLAIALSASFASADKATLLVKDIDAFQARIDLMKMAKREILASYFIVHNDDAMRAGLGALRQQARHGCGGSGCQVKILVDGLSNKMPAAMMQVIEQEPNMQIRLFHPLFGNPDKANWRMHDKALIVDGDSTAEGESWLITGGRNVSQKYFGKGKGRQFHDVDILITGNTAFAAREYFMALWNNKGAVKPAKLTETDRLSTRDCPSHGFSAKCSPTEVQANATRSAMELAETQLTVATKELLNDEDEAKWTITRDWQAELKPLKSAEFLFDDPNRDKSGAGIVEDLVNFVAQNTTQSLIILNPYVIPTGGPDGSLAFMKKLIDRGVRIEIVTNSEFSSDNVGAKAIYQKWRQRMLDIGIKIWEYKGPATTHAKAAVIDGRISLVGTFNFDPRSAFLNREIGIIAEETTESAPLATQLLAAIEDTKKDSWFIGPNGKAQLKPGEAPPPRSAISTRVLKKVLPEQVEILF